MFRSLLLAALVAAPQAEMASKSPRVAFSLSTPTSSYKAAVKGDALVTPKVELTLTLQNDSKGTWVVPGGVFRLEVVGQRGKRSVKKELPIGELTLPMGTTATRTVEVGALLTDVASDYMKGDDLTLTGFIRLGLPPGMGASEVNVQSEPIAVHVFVPEG